MIIRKRARVYTEAEIAAAIDAHVEAQARSMGYNDASACAGYVSSKVQTWAAEARAFIAWRDDVWTAAFALQAQHAEAGTVPTLDDVLAALPEWSE